MDTSPALVIFDLDGVIADTEPLHRRAKEQILAAMGCTVDLDLGSYVGRPNRELWEAVIERCRLDATPADLERKQYDHILDMMRREGTPLSHGLIPLLDLLDADGIACGLCSSSNQYYVDKVLDWYGLLARFGTVVCGDQVAQKKPAPDGYLKVLRDSGVPTEHTVAVEDSKAGTTSATSAGIRCIGYRNPSSGNQDLGQAFLQVDSLDQVASWIRNGCPTVAASLELHRE